MKAIETTGIIDRSGVLRLDNLLETKEKKVKVIILLQEENELDNEKLWLSSISNNPAFDFLKDREENIYSLKGGSLNTFLLRNKDNE
ncbi:MAG: hypothetical protein U9R42_02765 [Bacteroidota bacterium]|nr:hypothetical protein [Bacteroidota bacterium]